MPSTINDGRLPFPADITPDTPTYISGDEGGIPCPYSWCGPPTGTYVDGVHKIRVPMRISAADLKLALPYLVGFSSFGGPDNTLYRSTSPLGALPIRDPCGFGMVCTGIVEWYGEAATGWIPPDSNDFSEFFNDPEATGRTFDYNEPALCLYRYIVLTLEFEHVQYTVAIDAVAQGSTRGERERNMIVRFVPSIEYVSLNANVLKWASGPQAGEEIAFGGGFVRGIGDLQIDWMDVPAEALAFFITRWQQMTGALGDVMIGCVNDADWDVYIADQVVIFPAETLLFNPPRIVQKVFPTGFLKYDVFHSFSYRPETWNKFLYWPNGTYQSVERQNDEPLYPLVPFDEIFGG